MGFGIDLEAAVITLLVVIRNMNIGEATYPFHARGILINALEYPVLPLDSLARIIHEPRLPQMQGALLSKDRFAHSSRSSNLWQSPFLETSLKKHIKTLESFK
jgi:hypothetical protein